jgi:hypothetical protein
MSHSKRISPLTLVNAPKEYLQDNEGITRRKIEQHANEVNSTIGTLIEDVEDLDERVTALENPSATVTFSADKGGAGAVTLTSATAVQITFGTENWDVGGHYASDAWTPPAGKYHITSSVECSNTNAVDNESLTIHLRKNGADHRTRIWKRGSTTTQVISIDALVEANGTDVFTIFVTKGGAGNGASGTAAIANYFQGTAL